MRKYYLIAKNIWEEAFAYRLNFVMYRVRNVLTFLTMYFLWFSLLPIGKTLFGYDQSSILTYVLGTAVLQAFVLASRSYALGDDIINGNLSNFLLKPINYFYYWLAKDLGDKMMNITFAFIELSLLYMLLKPSLIMQTDILYVLFFLFSILIALLLYFLFNLLLGMIGFWSSEVWAPRFIFMVLISFFSGSYFPLDILPKPIYLIFKSLPFQYLSYFPLKIYLKQVLFYDILYGFLLGLLWLITLSLLVKLIWINGLKEYTAQGR